MARLQAPLLPFLYPCLESTPFRFSRPSRLLPPRIQTRRRQSTESGFLEQPQTETPSPYSHLNPPPTDYGRTIFADKATVTLAAGSGGHGCISFLRDKFIDAGPANGGDGGSGGSIYIQAVRGETSLHKLARRGQIRAGRGNNGQGKSKGGTRGDDVLVQVPVGTVVREVSRHDPVTEEEEARSLEEDSQENIDAETRGTWRRDKWVLYPSATPSEYATAEFPLFHDGGCQA